MKRFGDIHPYMLALFGAGFLFMMIASLSFALSAVRLRRRRGVQFICFAAAAVIFALSQGAAEIAKLLKRHNELGPFAAVISDWPAAVIGVLFYSLLFLLVFLLIVLIRTKKTSLTLDSIKESFDSLPDGVCFSDSDGVPLLINRKMQQLSFELTGSTVLNAKNCREHLLKGELLPGASVVQTEPTAVVKTENGVWNFRWVQHGNITEAIAYDVTEEYRLHDELEQQRERLSETNKRLWSFNKNIREFAKERELLKTRMRIHNDVGQLKLALRIALDQPMDRSREETLGRLWRQTAALLKNELPEQETTDSLDSLYMASETIGVRLVLSGELPDRGRNRELLLKAMFECVTNTAEHAFGDETCAVICENENTLCCTITNNGLSPEGEIRETGGLSNLRSAVEMSGGRMTIESVPVFRMVLELPKGGQLL